MQESASTMPSQTHTHVYGLVVETRMTGSFLDDPALIAPPRTVRIPFDDGSFVLRSPEPLKPYAR